MMKFQHMSAEYAAIILSTVFFCIPHLPLTADSTPIALIPATDTIPTESEVTNPRLTKKVDPVYPEEARQAELEATTILQVMIRKEGTVEVNDKSCMSCTVNRVGQQPEQVLRGWCEDFCLASFEAVAQWTYEPGTQDGEPVDVYFTVVVDYKLEY